MSGQSPPLVVMGVSGCGKSTVRAPWPTRIGQVLAEKPAAGPPVVACSALKRSYRDLLRTQAPGVVFMHLTGEAATIAARLNARAHEFMPSTLLESQLATLEALEPDEAHVLCDIAFPPEQMVAAAVQHLEGVTAPCPGDQDKVPA